MEEIEVLVKLFTSSFRLPSVRLSRCGNSDFILRFGVWLKKLSSAVPALALGVPV